jgi:hypothetical protein
MEPTTTNVTAQAATMITGNVIWFYVLIIALVVLVPHVIDIIKAYKSQNKMRELLVTKCAKDGLDATELKELLKEAAKSPPGITGLTRGAIAFTVIVILGIALFHLLITRTAQDSQVIGNVLSMVGSLIAAIVGFYFGGKTKEKAAEEATAEVTEKFEKVTQVTAKKAADEAVEKLAAKVIEEVKRGISTNKGNAGQ